MARNMAALRPSSSATSTLSLGVVVSLGAASGAAMTAAVQMLICTYGRSYREAQTYVSYLATVVSFVPLVVLFSGMKDSFWQLFVPVLAQQVVMSRVIRGEAVALLDWAIPSAVALAIAAACVFLVARLLREERIVFGRN